MSATVMGKVAIAARTASVSSATQTGFVFTSTTLLATVV